MWVDLRAESRAVRRIANYAPRRLASQAHATLRKKERARLYRGSTTSRARLRVNRATVVAVRSNRINRWLADRHHTLTPTLPKETHAPLLKIHAIKIQSNNLAHAPPRPVERLTECVGSLCISARKIAVTLLGCKLAEQALHVVQAKHRRKVATRTREINLRAD